MKDLTKAVVFDWGGIVESYEDDMRDIRELRERVRVRMGSPLSPEEAARRVKGAKGLANRTKIHEREDIERWWDEYSALMEINGYSVDDYIRFYGEEGEKVKFYPEVAEFARSVGERCVIAILSVLSFPSKSRLDRQYHLAAFDKVYLSFEMGLTKPDHRVFEYVQRDLGIAPENILLIDDTEANVAAARECGWQAKQCFGTDPQTVRDAVNGFLKPKSSRGAKRRK